MLDSVDEYFRSGQRLCLVGAFATSESRDLFSDQVQEFFGAWREALIATLHRAGLSKQNSESFALEILVGVQGGLVGARGLNDGTASTRTIENLLMKSTGVIASH